MAACRKSFYGPARATEFFVLIISTAQSALGLASGMLVGLLLGLVGGGGSILAVPLMVYVVGVPEPAYGDRHQRAGRRRRMPRPACPTMPAAAPSDWRCALHLRGGGHARRARRLELGKRSTARSCSPVRLGDDRHRRADAQDAPRTGIRTSCNDNMPAIVGLGLATGTLSGFFGIGGGFLIVPALVAATGMPIMNARRFLAGRRHRLRPDHRGQLRVVRPGLVGPGRAVRGGRYRWRAGRHAFGAAPSPQRRGALNIVFAVVIIAVALYMLARNISAFPA